MTARASDSTSSIAASITLALLLSVLCAVDARMAVALTAICLSLAAGFLAPVFVVFGLYYAVSQTVASVRLPLIPLSLNQMLFLGLMGSWVRCYLRGKIFFPQRAPMLAILSLAVFLITSALTGVSRELGLTAARTVVILFAASLAIASMEHSLPDLRRLFWAILHATVANGLVGMGEAILNRGIFDSSPHYLGGLFRINGICPNAIVFAHVCTFALPMALYLCRHCERPAGRSAAAISGGFLVMMIFRTLNLQSLLILPIILLAAAWLFRGTLAKRMLVGVAIVAVLAVPLVAPALSERLERMAQGQVDPSLRIRRDNRINAMEVFNARPLFGAGLGSYPNAWWPVRSFDTYYNQYEEVPRKQEVDFNYLRLLAETGVIGLALNMLLYVVLIVWLWQRRKRWLLTGNSPAADFASVLLLLWVLYLMSSFTQDTILYIRTWLMLALTAIVLGRDNILDRRVAKGE